MTFPLNTHRTESAVLNEKAEHFIFFYGYTAKGTNQIIKMVKNILQASLGGKVV